MSGGKSRKLLSPFPDGIARRRSSDIQRRSSDGRRRSSDGHTKRLSHGSKRQTVRKSEDVNFFRTCAKVLNKLGEDVTPKPLTELMQKYGQVGDRGSLNEMSSDFLMLQGSFMNSSYSVFGGTHAKSSASHVLANQSASFFDEIEDQTADQPFLTKGFTMPSDGTEAEYDAAQWVETEADRRALVEIYLTETEIFWLVDIAGDVASSEGEDAEVVRSTNETYMELLKIRPGNERYIAKGMGTMGTPLKSKGVQTADTTYANKHVAASWSSIYDTNGPFLGKEEAVEKRNAEVVQLIEEQEAKARENTSHHSVVLEAVEKSPEEDHHSFVVEAVEVAVDPQRKTVVAEDIGSVVSVVDVQADTTSLVADATDDIRILTSESFRKSLFVMERVINLNTYHRILSAYRGLPWLTEEPPVEEDKEEEDEEEQSSENLDLGPRLNRLWTYRCSVTKGHNVSCLGFNRANPDLLAVGYCQFEYAKQKRGLICCWSVKNPEFPERIYRTAEGVTAVSFCIKQPCLLAVGLRDGVIAIYNVSTSSKESVLDTLYNVPTRHTGPVWDLRWILRNRAGEGEQFSSNEMLMSVSLDGLVKQWTIRQGFECKDMLKLMRLPAKPTSEKKVKKGVDIVTSKYDGGLCFDFSPFDGDMYLVGTEDGYIHRCSCLYTEQSLDTYAGHTGPVYKVRWSPYDENVFVSCSGDYSVRLWHQTLTSPILTISSSMRFVPGVCWSPCNSTVVAFVNERAIEIWDLTENTLDPVILNSASTEGVKLSTVAFALNTDCLLVGDSEGQVAIYKLPEMVLQRDNQALALQNVVQHALHSHDNH